MARNPSNLCTWVEARTGRAADEPRAVQAVAIQPRSGGPARHGRSAVVRHGAAGERRPGAATGARRPGAALLERCGPGRRPERGGPARRPGVAPAALAAGLLAARWHGPGCPGPWLLAAAKLGLAAAREETRGEREPERDEWWGMNRFRVWGGLREHLTRSWAFGGATKTWMALVISKRRNF